MKKFFVVSMVLGLILSACGANPGADLDGSHWKLAAISGGQVPAGIEVTLNFEGDELGGNAGCNSYGAAYSLKGGKLEVEDAFSTMMYCEAAMDVETAYLQSLQSVSGYRVEGDQLVLLDSSGAELLRFLRQ